MADKLLIIMVNTDPENPTELGAPFYQATVAAAMEYDVEVVLSGCSGELAVPGVADKLIVQPESKKSVYHYIQEAYAAGVKFKVCKPMVELWGEDLIPEISEVVGTAYLISEAMDDNTVTFTY